MPSVIPRKDIPVLGRKFLYVRVEVIREKNLNWQFKIQAKDIMHVWNSQRHNEKYHIKKENTKLWGMFL